MAAMSNEQRKKIYAVARELGLDNDLLHEVVEVQTGKQHISDLSKVEAIRVIDYLEGLTSRAGRRTSQAVGGAAPRATNKQLWKIDQLAKALGWEDNPKRVKGFIKKYAGVDNPEWLTKAQAWRVIEGLKALLAKQENGGDSSGGDLDKISRSGGTP